MTTPTSFQTAGRTIRMAYQDAGLVQDGDEPNSIQYADGLLRLSDLCNLWQTQGLKLWLTSDTSVTLTAGTGTYTFGPTGSTVMTKPVRVLQGYWLSSGGVRTPLQPISRDEYVRLASTTTQGALSSYYVDKQQSQLSVSVWNPPDATAATGTLHLILQLQATTPVSLTDNTGFPVEWYMALRWGLADELSTGQPSAIMSRCAQRAASFRDALDSWDVEDASVTFTPDIRGASSFR